MRKKIYKKGKNEMNACVLKPIMPFVTRHKLKRTPATEYNRKIVEFLDSHKFSFNINEETEDLECTITDIGEQTSICWCD